MIATIILILLGFAALGIARHSLGADDRDRLRRTGAARVPGAFDRAELGVMPRADAFDPDRLRAPARGEGSRQLDDALRWAEEARIPTARDLEEPSS